MDIEDDTGETTLFSVTNVTNVTQILQITVWTDLGYPVISYNAYLTGYDVQSTSLGDVIRGGFIGSRTSTGSETVRRGQYSDRNPDIDDNNCVLLPGPMPQFFIDRVKAALTMGRTSAVPGNPQFPASDKVGNIHENAVGYVTIDVVAACRAAWGPGDPGYIDGLRLDNVLIGDYQQVHSSMDYAQVNPMVHIRAIPEGGSYAQRRADPARYRSRFPQTFYSRFMDPATPTADARQPLPSQFAIHWINGTTGDFKTTLKIWRQSVRGSNYDCQKLEDNGAIRVAESVTFDDRENGEGFVLSHCSVTTCIGDPYVRLPSTSRIDISDSDIFPQRTVQESIAGWMYLNLDDGVPANGAHQNWVVTSMRAEGRFSGDMDAIHLGNGCSPPAERSEASEDGTAIIGPAPNGGQ